jgi:hypothetical protein
MPPSAPVRRCALVTRSRGEFFLDVADEWQRIRVRISSSDAGLGPRPTRAVRAASRRRRSRDMTRICRCGLTAEQSGGQHDIMDPRRPRPGHRRGMAQEAHRGRAAATIAHDRDRSRRRVRSPDGVVRRLAVPTPHCAGFAGRSRRRSSTWRRCWCATGAAGADPCRTLRASRGG